MCFTIHPTEDDRGYLESHKIIDAKARRRVITERLVIREAVKNLLAKGYSLQLVESEGPLSPLTRQWQEVMKHLQACDEEVLLVYRHEAGGLKPRGSVVFIYGNDGYDVMADASLWVDAELEAVNKLAETLADAHIVEGS